jgi:hypothetical protein
MKTLKPGVRPVKHGGGADMDNARDVFKALKSERAGEFKSKHDLTIKAGSGLDASILKVMKDSWTTDRPDELLNSNGLFFSIWMDAACKAEGIVRYNLHARKLRAIKGEAFAAREFARSVRAQGKDELAGWPNWSFPKGPITLVEGHFPHDRLTLKSETSAMMDRFAAMVPFLDRLLDLRKR